MSFIRIALAALAGLIALILLSWYANFAARTDRFPTGFFVSVESDFEEVWTRFFGTPWYFDIEADGETFVFPRPDLASRGLVKLTPIAADKRNYIDVISKDGEAIHSWSPDWFTLWPDGVTLPSFRIPQVQPGAAVHGAYITDDGGVVFNFEKLSTVKMDACGNVVWKLANAGHHSIHVDEDGNFWVPGNRANGLNHPSQPNVNGPYQEDTIQKISPDGELLFERGLFDILSEAGQAGLLYLSTLNNLETGVRGDILHLNDIELFPTGFESDLFAPGDILLSLRNPNTIMVLDGSDFSVKYSLTGAFIRQHDPDFLPDGRIMVYDNNNLHPDRRDGDPGSRIVVIDPVSGAIAPYYAAAGETAFFSNIMGKQQILPNGNLMVTARKEARAFEVTPDGELVWQAKNLLGNGRGAILTEGEMLPPHMDVAFFEAARARCGG